MKYPIMEKLEALNKDGCYPFHMPGHKRKNQGIFTQDLYSYDITEISDFDDLHHPEGMIRDTMDFVKNIYGTQESYLLINSSTGGILSAISATCNLHDKILISRNCHKSVYHGIRLLGLEPIYIYPEIEDGICKPITKNQIEKIQKKHSDLKAVIIVSPTYEGNVSEIKEIADLLHSEGIPLIVDEAHGAHFQFHEKFPKSAVKQGADIVIQSLHKTLPSLTQTGLLHLNSDIIKKEKIEEFLGIYQSSSPSYIFMASMDYCVRMCQERKDLFNQYVENMIWLINELKSLKNLKQLPSDDIGKIVISTKDTGITGEELFSVLRDKYKLELEMAELTYVIAMTSICDEREDLRRLRDVLFEIDQQLVQEKNDTKEILLPVEAIVKMSPNEAKKCKHILRDIKECEGQIGADFVYLYPPGIPFIVPGEMITKDIILKIQCYIEENMKIVGLENGKISVVSERI